jgi:hypothetical protein
VTNTKNFIIFFLKNYKWNYPVTRLTDPNTRHLLCRFDLSLAPWCCLVTLIQRVSCARTNLHSVRSDTHTPDGPTHTPDHDCSSLSDSISKVETCVLCRSSSPLFQLSSRSSPYVSPIVLERPLSIWTLSTLIWFQIHRETKTFQFLLRNDSRSNQNHFVKSFDLFVETFWIQWK